MTVSNSLQHMTVSSCATFTDISCWGFLLLLFSVCQYEVTTFTGDHWAGGTDAAVFINLIGSKGDSGQRCLYTAPGSLNAFRAGQVRSLLLLVVLLLFAFHVFVLWCSPPSFHVLCYFFCLKHYIFCLPPVCVCFLISFIVLFGEILMSTGRFNSQCPIPHCAT